MGTGFLKIQLYVGDYALHGDSTTVLIKKDGAILHTLQTDENGKTATVEIPAPDLSNADGLEADMHFYSTVDVEVPAAHGYKAVKIYGLQIFDGITSDLDVHMEPTTAGKVSEEIVIQIPREHGVDIPSDNGRPDNHVPGQGPEDSDVPPEGTAADAIPVAAFNVPLANEVVIPEFITVHLGSPNAAARNVRVPFKEYVKNVVSSEIYPFWDRAAIEANTHAIVSFALNRLFTNAHRLGRHKEWREYGVCWQCDFTKTEEVRI